MVFVPYRGIRFLIVYAAKLMVLFYHVFVPYRGIRFLIVSKELLKESVQHGLVFVPYRGIRFLMTTIFALQMAVTSFRPLSGYSFSNPMIKTDKQAEIRNSFRPLSGYSFSNSVCWTGVISTYPYTFCGLNLFLSFLSNTLS